MLKRLTCGLVLAMLAIPAVADEEPGASQSVAVPAASTGYVDRARELVVTALALLGVDYKFGGDSPDAGLDCSGFVSYVFREAAGRLLPHSSYALSKLGKKVAPAELQPGDLVFFNTRRRAFSHVGIYIGEHRFVHAPRRGRPVEVVAITDRYWRQRFNGARRINP